MPSVEQFDSSQSMAALPSTMEIFDKFKPQENGHEKSDSEESFHLQLDDDDTENQSNSSSGKNSACNMQDETEDEILNKFDTSFKSENFDSEAKHEEGVLSDAYSGINSESSNKCDSDAKDNNSDLNTTMVKDNETEQSDSKVLVRIKQSDDDKTYEQTWGEGEFKSLYELEELSDATKVMVNTKELPENLKAENTLSESSLQKDNLSNNPSSTEISEEMEIEEISESHSYTSEIPTESVGKMGEDVLENDVEMPIECSDVPAVSEMGTVSENMLLEENKEETVFMDTSNCEIGEQTNFEQQTQSPRDLNDPLAEDEDSLEETTDMQQLLNSQKDSNDSLDKNTEFKDEDIDGQQGLDEKTRSEDLLTEEVESKDSEEDASAIQQPLKEKENSNDLLVEDAGSKDFKEEVPALQEPLDGQTNIDGLTKEEVEFKNCEEDITAIQEPLKEQANSSDPLAEITENNVPLAEITENNITDDHISIKDKTDSENLVDEQIGVIDDQIPIKNQIDSENLTDEKTVLHEEPIDSETPVKEETSIEKSVEQIPLKNVPSENKVLVEKFANVDLILEKENSEPNNLENINKEIQSKDKNQEVDITVVEPSENETLQQLENQEIKVESHEVLDEDKLTDATQSDNNLELVDNLESKKSGRDPSKEIEPKDLNTICDLKSQKTNDTNKISEGADDIKEVVTNEVTLLVNKNLVDNSSSGDKCEIKTCTDNEPRVTKSDENKEEIFGQPDTTDVTVQNENSCDNDEADLFDISIIRDADEDDACAMASAIEDQDAQEEAQSSEKSDDETIGQIEEDDTVVEDDDIDDDHHDVEIPMFDDEDTTMEVDQLIEEQQDNDHLLDSECHDISSDDTHSKDKETAKEIQDVSSNDTLSTDKEPQVIIKRNKILSNATRLETPVEEETRLKTPVEETLKDKDEEPELIIDIDDPQMKETASQLDESINIDDESSDSSSQNNKTDTLEKSKETKKGEDLTDKNTETVEQLTAVVKNVETRRSSNKRTLSEENNGEDQLSAQKKRKISESATQDTTTQAIPDKVKTLTAFAKYMQCKKFSSKLSRSDLEQFCIQKICETFIAKSEEGELHHTIRKQEKLIEGLRKDLQQLSKQCKDLEIVNKKLMNELRNQNNNKKPLVPLKITRSVGLQVRLSAGNETSIPTNVRKRQCVNNNATPAASPQKQPPQRPPSVNNIRPKMPSNPPTPAVKQPIPAPSPQKSPLVTAAPTVQTTTIANNNTLLSQALQTTTVTNRRASPVVAKRTATPVRQINSVTPVPEIPKSGNPGVIDLTDEDDKRPATIPAGQIRILNKATNNGANVGKTITLNKVINKQSIGNAGNQGKVGSPNKTVNKGSPAGTPTRLNLQQGVRLTPGSVINTSTAGGSPQMVYVLPTIGNSKGGQQIAFVNLASSINGSAMMSKPITLKTSGPGPRKHPAPLPTAPRLPPDPLLKPVPPKPHLTIKKIDTGIILQWKMPYNLDLYESIASYQLYAYQETSAPPNTDMWRKVGDVKALALPMACTLTQFADKNKYYFAVRSVDVHKRIGAFSDPEEISL